jgi:hypothetical protein
LRRRIDAGDWKAARRQIGDTLVFIERVLDGLDLAYDVEELARGDDPPALLARKILILGRPGGERSELLAEARAELEELASAPHWRSLDEIRDAVDPLSDAALSTLLIRSGTAALAELLAQRDQARGAAA